MRNTPISLYDCKNARFPDNITYFFYIHCSQGHNIGKHHIRQIERGEPLRVRKCSLCEDADLFDTDPQIILDTEKGWLK